MHRSAILLAGRPIRRNGTTGSDFRVCVATIVDDGVDATTFVLPFFNGCAFRFTLTPESDDLKGCPDG